MAFKVWIDRADCIGNGVCAEVCPEMFVIENGLAYLREQRDGAVVVPAAIEAAVIEAAECCPTECIFIEACDAS